MVNQSIAPTNSGNTTKPRYQIIVKNKAGDIIGELSTWLNLKFGDKHNYYGSASFDVPLLSLDLIKLISLRRYEINIVRNGVVVWSGEQAGRNVTILSNGPNLVKIECFTYPEMLNSRFSEPYVRYDNVDQAQILKNLVDYSQGLTNGDFGFTFAPFNDTMLRDREYYSQNIFEAFYNMSNDINGIDFWIDKDKVIHMAAKRGSDKSRNYIFELGVNMLEPNIDDNFSSPANEAIALGAGFGSSQVIGTFTDTAARSIYLLRQQRISQTDISDPNNLNSKAEDYVASHRIAIRSIKFNQVPSSWPVFGSLSIGDIATFKIKKGSYDINTKFRIYQYDVTIGKEGEEYVSYVVA